VRFEGKCPPKWRRPQDAGEKEMLLLTRSSMHLRRDMGHKLERSRLEVMVGNCCSVGHVANINARRIFHCTKMVGLRYTVLRRRRQLGCEP